MVIYAISYWSHKGLFANFGKCHILAHKIHRWLKMIATICCRIRFRIRRRSRTCVETTEGKRQNRNCFWTVVAGASLLSPFCGVAHPSPDATKNKGTLLNSSQGDGNQSGCTGMLAPIERWRAGTCSSGTPAILTDNNSSVLSGVRWPSVGHIISVISLLRSSH